MIKVKYLLILLFACSSSAWSQQTPVAATVVDPSGNPYTFSAGSASIQCPGNQQPTYNGSPLSRTIIFNTDGNGHFTLVLWDVSAIQPTGCSWRFAITYSDGITSFTTGNITGITGSGLINLSASISNYAVPLPSSGSTGVNSLNTLKGALTLSGSNGININSTNGNTITISNNNSVANGLQEYRAQPSCSGYDIAHCTVVDFSGKICTDPDGFHQIFTASSTLVTTPSTCAPFTIADIGKPAFGTYNCAFGAGDGRCEADLPQTTISSYVDAHNVHMTLPAAHTSGMSGIGSNLYWGPIQTTQLQAAMAATQALSVSGPVALQYGCGITGFDGDINQISRNTINEIDIRGCPTTFVAMPIFVSAGGSSETGPYLSDPNSCGQGTIRIACADKHSDMTFTGLGLDVAQSGSSWGVNEVAHVYGANFVVFNNINVLGSFWNDSSHLDGIHCVSCTIFGGGSFGGGWNDCRMGNPGGAPTETSTMIGGLCGGTSQAGLLVSGGITSTFGVFINSSPGPSFTVNDANAIWNSYGDSIYTNGTISNGQVNWYGTYPLLAQIIQTGGVFRASGVDFTGAPGGEFINQSSGTPLFIDSCGNKFPSSGAVIANGGIGATCSAGFSVPFAKVITCASTTEGQTTAINDSSTVTWGATVTGGGSGHIKMYCDGTNPTVMAK